MLTNDILVAVVFALCALGAPGALSAAELSFKLVFPQGSTQIAAVRLEFFGVKFKDLNASGQFSSYLTALLGSISTKQIVDSCRTCPEARGYKTVSTSWKMQGIQSHSITQTPRIFAAF